ncbi:MAG: ABC transporter ATP-binding protein/permease [Proteobacteria bacterium]|nr:ABC transporter ATP-binding protein/permease [Pseudomonadota bacterium]
MKKNRFTSAYGIYKLSLDISGDYAAEFKRSLVYFIIAFITQGLAFGMFYPLLKSMFAESIMISEIFTWLGIMVLLSLVSLATKWKGHNFDFQGKIIDVVYSLRTKLGASLRKMPLERLSAYKTGDLNSIFASNVEESVIIMGMVASMIAQLLFVPTTIILVTLFFDYRLALLMIVLFPVAIPLYYRIRKSNLDDKTAFNQANANLEAGFIEYIQGLPVLRAVNKTGTDARELQTAIKHVRSVQKKGLYKTQAPFVMIGLIVHTVLLIILAFGSFFVLNNTLQLVTLAASLVIVARLTEPITVLVNVVKLFDLIDSAFIRIKSILTSESLEIHKPVREPESFDIEFDQVDFSYQTQKSKTIDGVSFLMPNKKMTAIVGNSGGGKTTLTRLIMRYADVQKGTIKIGGVDIKNLDPDDLMRHISVVFQDVYLFDDTILNNIKMANPEATDEEVKDAASAAYCHEFISRLPDGYDTRVGDIGGSLSGGEKQRISIARAILKNAPIVILDEPTAALDTESEVAVQSAIDKLVKDRTVIVIAHRLSTISGADNILVVDGGKVIESGKHDALIEKKGKYFNMWSAQQRAKEWHIHT